MGAVEFNSSHTNAICESCRANPSELRLESDQPDQPYCLCGACYHRIERFSLRPLEWFNLAAVHGPNKHLLHDDFYTDNGIACVAEDVSDAALYPAPTLSQVKSDLEHLVDFAMTLYSLSDEVILELSKHNKQDLLGSLQQRVESAGNIDIAARSYEICAFVLRTIAESWVREQWLRPVDEFYSLCEATAACLPFEEGFEIVTAEMEKKSLRDLAYDCFGFAPFRSARTLDWMERHSDVVLHANWGSVAALSEFSWDRANSWLNLGRPLSLRALEALIACLHYDTELLKRERPHLLLPEAATDMSTVLEDYLARDPVPNVRHKVEFIKAASNSSS
ncbi:MAG: hypothetical protein ABIY70_18600 [Capsulimonas sp.]|uniref:hypothetical protein n=1 Tax=Capsulimonas sp. TaxID=2494211 RepID=UPI00326596C9